MGQSNAPSFPPSAPPGASRYSQLTARGPVSHSNQASNARTSKILTCHAPNTTSSSILSFQLHSVIFAYGEDAIEIDDTHSLSERHLGYSPPIHDPLAFEEAACDKTPVFEYGACSIRTARVRPSLRSLTSPFNVFWDEMATVASAPGSPPDLSESRSSQTSSYASTSQFSNPDGVISDLSHFEEVGLGEERKIPATDPHPAQPSKTTRRPVAPRVTTAGPWINPSLPYPQDGSAVRRPIIPSPLTQAGRLFPDSVQRPIYPSARSASFATRNFTSPSLPMLSGPLSSSQPRTRSNSPSRSRLASTSTTILSSTSLRPSPVSPRSSLPLPPRRGSWQPNRKSIQELEAEYHDSDDDLPEDASLWNVPMSPRPPEDRISPRSSHHGSPERHSGPRPIPLSHTVSAPDTPPQKPMYSRSLPKVRPPPPRTSSLTAATGSGSGPSSPNPRQTMRHMRAKSWTLAVAELSEEAKILSENLEYHAEATERAQEDRIQNGHRSARTSLETVSNRGSFRSSTIQLPPVQKGNLDFMPISKEKEAILSRTRPSWLPPKDRREEKKHLKEYQIMMAASLQAEKKREERLHMRKCQKDDTREALNRLWESYVSPGVDVRTSEEEVRELWWRGISPRVRGQVWQRAVGNQLGLTDASYSRALQRAKDLQMRDAATFNDTERLMLTWFYDIKRDAETAFPELNLFQQGGPLWQDLVDVCEAYSCYRNDVGYVYGIQLVAAMLLLQLHTPDAVFILLANFLNRPMPLAFVTDERGSTSRTYGFAMSTLAIKFPRLHTYLFGFEEQGGLAMGGEEVFEAMFRTLFANGLDVDRLSRVWDCWVFDGDRTLVRTAVAILGCLQSQIFDIEGSADTKRRNIQDMLAWGPYGRSTGYWDLHAAGDQDAFMEEVREAGKLDYTGR